MHKILAKIYQKSGKNKEEKEKRKQEHERIKETKKLCDVMLCHVKLPKTTPRHPQNHPKTTTRHHQDHPKTTPRPPQNT